MKFQGFVVVAIAMLVPLIWLPGIAQNRDIVALFSQYLGLMALIAMAISQLIATRWRGIEALFGPLDQSYRLHKWLGIGAMVAILLHDTIDAEMRGLGRETALVEVAETAGEISLYGLLVLVAITVATFVPYHLWKWTHRLIGIFFVLGAFHYLFILKPFKNGDPLGLYMALVCVLGLIAYAYTSAPRGLRPSRAYRISRLVKEGNAVAVEMTPSGKSVSHRPGQFAFFGFKGAGLTEPHPFTISSPPSEGGNLRVTIAPLGDFTARLSRMLSEGQDVTVEGPFGRFGQGPNRPQVWVAAGVGVTPFMALAGSLKETSKPVEMVYSVRDATDAAHLAELREIVATKENLSLTLWESKERGRLDAEAIAGIAGDLKGKRVLFCGPTEMRKALMVGLAEHGLSRRNFHYEAFEIRTGLGLKRFLNWLWARRERIAMAGR